MLILCILSWNIKLIINHKILDNKNQKTIATEVIKQLQQYFEDKIVTEISPLAIFYEAEQEHQNYYRENAQQGYCSFVIAPKLAKLRKLHADKLV